MIKKKKCVQPEPEIVYIHSLRLWLDTYEILLVGFKSLVFSKHNHIFDIDYVASTSAMTMTKIITVDYYVSKYLPVG